MTEATNPISPLCDDSRLEMPDISKLGGVLPFGGVRDAARGQNIPVPGPTPAPNPVKRKPPVSATAETVRITRAPKIAALPPVVGPSPRARAASGMPAVRPTLPQGVLRGRGFAGLGPQPGTATSAPKAPAAPVLPKTSVNPEGASQASGGVAAAAHESGQPSPAGVHPVDAALNKGVETAKGIGYGRAARIGGGLGAAVGVLAPGEEKDENGNVVQKSRIGGALHGALAGAGAGLAGNFAKNRVLGTGLLGNGMPHTAARPNHMASRAAAAPAAPAPSAAPVAPAPVNPRFNGAPAAPARTMGRDAAEGVDIAHAATKLPPVFKEAGADKDVPNAEKATDPELNPEASKKLPYKVPSLKLKK